MTHQCPSCGGWCGYTKAKGCNYADLPIQQDLQTMISRNGELEQQMQGLSNEINDFQNIIQRQRKQYNDLVDIIQRQRKQYNDLVDKVLAGTDFAHIDDYLAWRNEPVEPPNAK